MSDTPRTDACISNAWTLCGIHVVSAEFARQLERELAEMDAARAEAYRRLASVQSESGTPTDDPAVHGFTMRDAIKDGLPPSTALVLYDDYFKLWRATQSASTEIAMCPACEREWSKSAPSASAAITDTQRVDFLQAQSKGYGGWIFRQSVTGRGMRLHETTQAGARPTVREAIDAAMKGEK